MVKRNMMLGVICMSWASACATPAQDYLQICTVPSNANAVPSTLAATGCFSDTGEASSQLTLYSVNMPLYADGASKQRWIKFAEAAPLDANGVVTPAPVSGVFKEFSIDGVRLETRLLFRDAQGTWTGFTYAWNDAQDRADLLTTDGATGTVQGHSWTYPSQTDCLTCHSNTAEDLLGVRAGQLEQTDTAVISAQVKEVYPQMTALVQAHALKPVSRTWTPWPALDSNASVESRARAYLAANCSHCHQPGGASGTNTDFRFETSLANMGVCNVAPQRGTFNIANAALLAPGAPGQSIISYRMHSITDGERMPPLGRTTVDTAGVAVVDAWISSLSDCQ